MSSESRVCTCIYFAGSPVFCGNYSRLTVCSENTLHFSFLEFDGQLILNSDYTITHNDACSNDNDNHNDNYNPNENENHNDNDNDNDNGNDYGNGNNKNIKTMMIIMTTMITITSPIIIMTRTSIITSILIKILKTITIMITN